MHHAAIESRRIEVSFLVHRTGGPFGFGIESRDTSFGERSIESVGPAFGEIDIVGNAAGDSHVVDVAIAIFGRAAHGGIILPRKDENFPGRRREFSGDLIGRTRTCKNRY